MRGFEEDRKVGGATRADENDAHAPGRSTLTQAIDAGGQPAAGSGQAGAPGPSGLPRLDLNGGAPLPENMRTKFEGSLGTDLSGVRVHTGGGANDAAGAMGARAFAVGKDIVFNEGQYQPGTKGGDQLIAHEVAHTVQQKGAPTDGPLQVTTPGDSHEREADNVAAAMVSGGSAEVSASPAAIARKTLEENVEAPSGGGDGGGGVGAVGGESESKASESEQGGELSAGFAGKEEIEGTEPVAEHNEQAVREDIKSKGEALPDHGGAEEFVAGGPKLENKEKDQGGGGGSDEMSPEMKASMMEAQADAREASEQAEAESAAYKAEMAEQRERLEAQQNAIALEQLKAMSPADKRAQLIEMGYDKKAVKKMKDAELDGIIAGRIESENRRSKIMGMDPDELKRLSPGEKAKFLEDLGIDKKDITKIGPAAAGRAFDDIMRVAHTPGQHKVKVKVKGGLLGKSWEVTIKVDAEGNPEIEAKKKGGFLSKLWGYVKMALPIIAVLLAPVTGGASLIALAVYQTAVAIKNGDWLGAIVGAAGAFVGLGAIKGIANGLKTIATVAEKVQKVAQAAQAAVAAAKAKNAGSLLGALSAGAAAFSSFAAAKAGKFATTMTKWSDKLEKWSKIVQGGEKLVKATKTGDVAGALTTAFDTVAAQLSKKDESGKETNKTSETISRYTRMAQFATAGVNAAKQDPPGFGQLVDVAMGMAGEFKLIKADGNAAKLTAAATKMGIAIASKDPTQLTAAAMGLAEAIHLSRMPTGPVDKDKDGKDDKVELKEKYAKAGRVIEIATQAVVAASKKPRPDYASALDAGMQMIAEFTEDKRLDKAAKMTAALDKWTKAVGQKNEMAIIEAGAAFGEAIMEFREELHSDRDKAKTEVQKTLAPGEPMPEGTTATVPNHTGGGAPGEPLPLLPSRTLDFGPVGLMPALDPVRPEESLDELAGPGTSSGTTSPTGTADTGSKVPISASSRRNTPNGNYTVVRGDTLSGLAKMFGTSMSVLEAENPQLENGFIFVGQKLYIPNMETVIVRPEPTGAGVSGTTTAGGTTNAGPTTGPTIGPARPGSPTSATKPKFEPPDWLDAAMDAIEEFVVDSRVPEGRLKAVCKELIAVTKVVRGKTDTGHDTYDLAVDSFKALVSTGKFTSAFGAEISAIAAKLRLGDTSGVLARLDALSGAAEKIGKFFDVPSQAKDLYLAMRELYQAVFVDTSSSMADRALKAGTAVTRITTIAATLPGDFRDSIAFADVVKAKLPGGSIGAAITTVRNAATRAFQKYGPKAAEVLTSNVERAIQGLANQRGVQVASEVATRWAAEISSWGSSQLARVSSKAALRTTLAALGTRLAGVVAFGASAPVMIAFEILRFELVVLPALYLESLNAFDMWLTTALYGEHITTVRNRIRSWTSGSTSASNATIRNAYDLFLNGRVRRGWHNYIGDEIQKRSSIAFLSPQARRSAAELIERLNEYYLDRDRVAEALKEIALQYIEETYEEEFNGREAPDT